MNERYHVLDLLRGLLLINAVLYHGLYDYVYVFDRSCIFMQQHSAYLWQQTICTGFILLAGCSCTLSRNPAKHGSLIFACALLITAVTCIVIPDERILFGVLHLIGLSYLLTAFFKPLLSRLPALPMMCLSLILFLLFKGIYYGYLGIWDYALWYLPEQLYQYPLLFLLGLPDASFFSADYFPLIPWLFLFGVGYFGGPMLLQSRVFYAVRHWKLPVINWIGQHTLFLYMLHQPILYGLLTIFLS